MPAIYHGWTPSTPKQTKNENEINAVAEMLADHPTNQYWRNRWIALTGKLQTPAEDQADMDAADWNAQITELRGGL